jgi:hypothetical protein
LERSLGNLKKLWNAANLSHTPKVHSLLHHATKQMQKFEGIGDLLEDDVEKMHQIAGNFEARSSRLNSATGRAVAQSKMEAISHNNLVQQQMQHSQQLSKRKLDVNNSDTKKERIKVSKTERDQKRVEVVPEIENKPFPKLITAYEKLKEDIKKSNSNK